MDLFGLAGKRVGREREWAPCELFTVRRVWEVGSRGKIYRKYMGNCSTLNFCYTSDFGKKIYLLKGIDQVVYMIRIAKAKVYDVLANFRVPIFYRRQKFA